MDDFWTVWTLGLSGYWVRMESFSTRKAAEAAILAYRGKPYQLRDPRGVVRREGVA